MTAVKKASGRAGAERTSDIFEHRSHFCSSSQTLLSLLEPSVPRNPEGISFERVEKRLGAEQKEEVYYLPFTFLQERVRPREKVDPALSH